MADPTPIMVKFTTPGKVAKLQRAILGWVGEQLLESKQVFPDSEDDELSTMFEVYLKSGCDALPIAEQLQGQKEIEYAHLPADRQESV